MKLNKKHCFIGGIVLGVITALSGFFLMALGHSFYQGMYRSQELKKSEMACFFGNAKKCGSYVPDEEEHKDYLAKKLRSFELPLKTAKEYTLESQKELIKGA